MGVERDRRAWEKEIGVREDGSRRRWEYEKELGEGEGDKSRTRKWK
jgi:hypothetical protein